MFEVVMIEISVTSINDHTYNSLIWHTLTRLTKSCRMRSRLIKILHYWVWWESLTRKSRSRDDRDEVRRKTRRKNQRFLITLSFFKCFSICFRNIHLINVIFLHIYFDFNHQIDIVAIQHIRIYLLVYDIFWSSSK